MSILDEPDMHAKREARTRRALSGIIAAHRQLHMTGCYCGWRGRGDDGAWSDHLADEIVKALGPADGIVE